MRIRSVQRKHGFDRADKLARTLRRAIGLGAPLILLLLSLGTVTAVWCWLATAGTLKKPSIDFETKLDCVSYAPFREGQSPWNSTIIISSEQIAADLAQLAKVSRCVRTYSVENGLDKVPELASKVGLKVLLGVWIGRDRLKNAQLINTALSLVRDFSSVITAVIVGSEVMLRGEMKEADLRKTIRSVKAQVDIPVSYADVWEFWLRHPDISADVDFVTIHILPYWEDSPVRAEDAAAHLEDVRQRVISTFPGKEIFIGEAGWPSRGRMRQGALPSKVNQARFISDILDRARTEHFRVNLFEAYDEPWKRQWEGTVGGSWGLFDGISREIKYPSGAVVSNYPFWKLQLGCGLAFSLAIFGAALVRRWRRPSMPGLASWVSVAISATVGGILLGVSVEKTFYESYGLHGFLVQTLLLIAGVVAPPLCSIAQMSQRAPPKLLELVGWRAARVRSLPAIIMGGTLAITTLIAAETALGLVLDPRWRDFPFASLTMAVVPFCTLVLLNGCRDKDLQPLAESMFAGLFAAAAPCILLREGLENWQALWTSAAYLLLGATLWPAPLAAVANRVSRLRAVAPEIALLGMQGHMENSAPQPTDVAIVQESAAPAAKGAATRMTKVE
jgi:exo-beta-1,3-glucanase (GH17 family)